MEGRCIKKIWKILICKYIYYYYYFYSSKSYIFIISMRNPIVSCLWCRVLLFVSDNTAGALESFTTLLANI